MLEAFRRYEIRVKKRCRNWADRTSNIERSTSNDEWGKPLRCSGRERKYSLIAGR